MINSLPLSQLLLGENLPDDLMVSGLTLDSRHVQAGFLFVALAGTQQHGLRFAESAQEKGAVAVVWESTEGMTVPELNIPMFEIADLGQKLGQMADRFYKKPSQSLQIIGITGTDGKTSVSHFIAQALGDFPCAVIGTLGIGLPENMQQATHTTPDVISVHQILDEQRKNAVKCIAMEVSSHALDQGRVNQVAFDTAVFTNLTRDHLDYHKTVEAYAAAKEKLFHWDGLKTVVLNLDDAMGLRLYNDLENKGVRRIAYSLNVPEKLVSQDQLIASNACFDHTGIKANILTEDGTYPLQASVLGRFNLSNLLATLGALLSMGVSLTDALKRVQTIKTVPGRMQKVFSEKNDHHPLVVVDYAHTPGALESALKALREHTKKRLICVFGCGGDRDTGKRPLMAQAAETYADVVIVTDDNPRSESPEQIFTDITSGFENTENIVFEHGRDKAIAKAIAHAEMGDVVLLAGKGHEKVQIFADHTVSFSDYEHAENELAIWSEERSIA
jgi:UDP-N-acetylmuramoyl-L-alanyl-D-glutamate--2,6-diaminopimelate ligase